MYSQDIAYEDASQENTDLEIDDVTPYKYEQYYDNNNVSTDDLFQVAMEEGYDGVILQGIVDAAHDDGIFATDVFIARDSSQIKLADGTNVTFNEYTNDIRFQLPNKI